MDVRVEYRHFADDDREVDSHLHAMNHALFLTHTPLGHATRGD